MTNVPKQKTPRFRLTGFFFKMLRLAMGLNQQGAAHLMRIGAGVIGGVEAKPDAPVRSDIVQALRRCALFCVLRQDLHKKNQWLEFSKKAGTNLHAAVEITANEDDVPPLASLKLTLGPDHVQKMLAAHEDICEFDLGAPEMSNLEFMTLSTLLQRPIKVPEDMVIPRQYRTREERKATSD